MRAKRAHKQNMSTTATSASFNKLVRVDWSFVLTSAVSSSKSFGMSKEGEGEEEEAALVTTNDQSTRTSLLKEDVTVVDMLCLCARFARIRYEADVSGFPRINIEYLRV